MKISNVAKGEQVAIFNNIGIETSAKCNRHCHFCPNDYFKRPDELMDEQLFTKIVDELGKLKYKGRVELYIYNEPTKDKRLERFIRYVRKQVPSACIMISTNGDYLKSENDILKYFDAGLNQFLFNIYSANDKSLDSKVFENGVIQAQKRMDLIQSWMDKVTTAHRIPQNLSMYQNIGPKKQTMGILRKFGIQRLSEAGLGNDFESISNRAGNIDDFRGAVKDPLVKHCTKPFRFLNINWKGNALLCCNDFYGKTNMGNANEQSLVDIWNGEKFNIYRLRLQNKNRSSFLCVGCDSNGGYYPHMINAVTFGPKKDKQILNTKYYDVTKE
jgi:GTP 3',8-cyclase